MNIKSPSLARQLLAVCLLATLLLYGVHYFERDLSAVELWIADLGALAPLAFITVFALVTPLFVSVDVLCFAAGVLFPLSGGLAYTAVATYLAAALIFLLGRKLLYRKIRVIFLNSPRFALLDAVIAASPFKLMLLLRLTPLPFALLSYACSITAVEFWPYMGATSGILVYETVIVYLGYTAKHVSTVIGNVPTAPQLKTAAILFGLVMAISLLAVIVHIARKELRARLVQRRN